MIVTGLEPATSRPVILRSTIDLHDRPNCFCSAFILNWIFPFYDTKYIDLTFFIEVCYFVLIFNLKSFHTTLSKLVYFFGDNRTEQAKLKNSFIFLIFLKLWSQIRRSSWRKIRKLIYSEANTNIILIYYWNIYKHMSEPTAVQ